MLLGSSSNPRDLAKRRLDKSAFSSTSVSASLVSKDIQCLSSGSLDLHISSNHLIVNVSAALRSLDILTLAFSNCSTNLSLPNAPPPSSLAIPRKVKFNSPIILSLVSLSSALSLIIIRG